MPVIPQKSFVRTVFTACLLASILSPLWAAPRVIQTQFPTDDYVIASVVATDTPFSAHADGRADCTAAIQAAIDAAAGQGGGVVFLPAGRYRCDGNLVLKEGVTLRGDWKAPGRTAAVGGTVLMPYAGRAHEDGPPFIAMQRGTGVRNLSIWYPEQQVENPVAYPWTLADDPAHTGDSFTVHQVTLVNPYQGIKFGPQFNELFTVRQVYGTPLRTGMQFDSVTDIGRILDLHFGPRFWLESGLGAKPDAAALNRWLFAGATGIEMRRSDWQYFFHVSVQGYARGLYIRKGAQGGSIGVAYDFRATQCAMGLLVGETRFVATKCRFEGRTGGVVTTDGFQDDLQFNDCDLVSDNGPALTNGGTGAVRLVNSRLTAHGPAVQAAQGQVTLLNCDLPGRGPQVVLARPVARALLLGDRFGEPSRALQSASRGDVQTDNQPYPAPRLSIPALTLPPDPKPATARLFNVVEFGAQPGKSDTPFDNTAPFQAALDAAGKAGGGTVFVPAGFYRFGGHLTVPTGVEMRGVFDVPHHTVSLGSVLMPTEGRDHEAGPPFLQLAAHSGLRGLTFWYPEQFVDAIRPYPWTVRSRGPGCWMMDDTTANSYNFVDFGTFPSDGHLLRYVAGSPLKHGVWVSKGSGVVDDCQFNPHYWLRNSPLSPPLTQSPTKANLGDTLFNFLVQNHDAFVFGHCPNETQVNNFVYGSSHGLRFVDDGGATGGWVINHATDGSSEGLTVDAAAASGLNIVNTQIAIVGDFKRRAVSVGAHNQGSVALVGGYSFGVSDVPTMVLDGNGPTLVQSWHTSQGEIQAGGGPKQLESIAFTRSLPVAVRLSGPESKLDLVGDTTPVETGFAYAPPQTGVTARGNGRALPPTPLALRFATRFGPGDPAPDVRTQSVTGVADALCRVEPGAGRHGAALVISGTPDPQQHAIAYYAVYDVNLDVKADTVLRYWLRPDSASGTHTAVDLVMTDGTTLRDSGAVDTSGSNMHPGADKGNPGYWGKVEGKIGVKLAGKTIKTILFAFDQGDARTPLRAAVDSIEIGEPKP